MPGYRARRKENDFIEQEAKGEDVYTGEPTQELLVKLNSIWGRYNGYTDYQELCKRIVRQFELDGVTFHIRQESSPIFSVRDGDDFCDFIEFWLKAHVDFYRRTTLQGTDVDLEDIINLFFQQERYDKKLVEGALVPYKATLSYQGLESALTIVLSGDDYTAVRKSVEEALREHSNGEYRDCVTDGGRALEEYLSVHGCTGLNLSNQIDKGLSVGFIHKDDKPLWDWLRITRNKYGDAHDANTPTAEKAWSFIEVVGSVLSRYK